MTEFIPLSIPYLSGNEAKYLQQCVTDNWVSTVGPFVSQFEEEFAKKVGAKYAVATASGTSALHLALHVANIGPDDLVLVSDLTFIASANSIRYVGAEPVLIDCDPLHWQMDLNLVERFLETDCEVQAGKLVHKASGKRVAAIMPVHVLGYAVDMQRLMSLAKRYGLDVIEDASEGLGASINGKSVGTIGRFGCFSFNGNKMITSGSGGMVVCDKQEDAIRLKHLSQQAKQDGVDYIHDEVGYNYRMTNVHAALGMAQLESLDKHLKRKKAIADRYLQAFAGDEAIYIPGEISNTQSAWWLFTVALKGQKALDVVSALAELKIQTRPLWQPMHFSPVHKDCLYVTENQVSGNLYKNCVSLPCSPELEPEQQDRVIQEIKSLCQK